jgi:hypothetical protein
VNETENEIQVNYHYNKKESTKELNENDTITKNEVQNDALTMEISITKN